MRNTFSSVASKDRNGKILQVAAVAVAVALGVAACGSSSKPSSSTTTPAGSSSSSGGTAATETAAAQTKVDALLKDPTNIPTTTPLTSKPVAGKTFVNLQCNLGPNCAVVNSAMKAASEAAGWKFKSIPVDLTNPATLLAGIQQALQLSDLGAVSESGIPVSLLASGMTALAKKHIPLVPIATGATPAQFASTVPAVAEGDAEAQAHGNDLAQYFIANSAAAGSVLVVGVPQIPSQQTIATAFVAAAKAGCTGCTTKEVDVTSAQVNTGAVTGVIVSSLQRNPSIKWAMSTNCGFNENLPSALDAAGITGIHYICSYPDVVTEQNILSGKVEASTLTSYSMLGWQCVDAALRYTEGMTITADVGRSPEQILTKANVGTPAQDTPRPSNYQDLFKALWHVS